MSSCGVYSPPAKSNVTSNIPEVSVWESVFVSVSCTQVSQFMLGSEQKLVFLLQDMLRKYCKLRKMLLAPCLGTRATVKMILLQSKERIFLRYAHQLGE